MQIYNYMLTYVNTIQNAEKYNNTQKSGNTTIVQL